MSDTTKTEVRVIEGWAASFQGSNGPWWAVSPRQEVQRDIQCSLVIGDKAVPMSKVVEMVREIVESAAAGDELTIETIAAKYGIKLP